MRLKGVRLDEYVTISKKFADDLYKIIDERGMKKKHVSKWVLGGNPDYLSNALGASKTEHKMPAERFERLCEWAGLSPEAYIITEDSQETQEEPQSEKGINTSAKDAESICEASERLEKAMRELLLEQKTTNTILREILRFAKHTSDNSYKMVEAWEDKEDDNE